MPDAILGAATSTTTDNKPDAITNLKGEMDRKLTNLEASNKKLMDQLTAITARLTPPPPKKETKTVNLKDIWYDDPEQAANIIRKQTKDEIMAEYQRVNAEQQRHTQTLQGLVNTYPELSDNEHPATIKTLEIFSKFTDEEKSNPLSYQLAAERATRELNILPKNKRNQDDDSFSLDGRGTTGGSGRKSKKEPELDPRTIEFARLVGFDVEKPEVLASLKVRASRKNWTKWE